MRYDSSVKVQTGGWQCIVHSQLRSEAPLGHLTNPSTMLRLLELGLRTRWLVRRNGRPDSILDREAL